jgi:hypothetical protein
MSIKEAYAATTLLDLRPTPAFSQIASGICASDSMM